MTQRGPAWYTPAVQGLVQQINEEGRLTLLPILADALEEAGFADEATLLHLRYSHGPNDTYCWVVHDLENADFHRLT